MLVGGNDARVAPIAALSDVAEIDLRNLVGS
jgi:hypothetical protein